MRANPLRKLWDRHAPLPADAEDALRQLARLTEDRPELADLAVTHAALLRAAFDDVPPAPSIHLEATHAATKLATGVPLLRGERLTLDPKQLTERYLRLCAALMRQDRLTAATESRHAAAVALRESIKRGDLDISALTTDVLDGDPRAVSQRAADLELDAGLAGTLLRWTLLPLLEQTARELAPLHARSSWDRGYCPTCGAWPALAESRGIEQTRLLRCGLCASAWTWSRTQCPFCDSRLAADLGYLYAEGTEAAERAVTCERCHHYYKAVATLTAIPAPQLAVVDLRTLYLDLIAIERGYMASG